MSEPEYFSMSWEDVAVLLDFLEEEGYDDGTGSQESQFSLRGLLADRVRQKRPLVFRRGSLLHSSVIRLPPKASEFTVKTLVRWDRTLLDLDLL